jgi:hypothetical protein
MNNFGSKGYPILGYKSFWLNSLHISTLPIDNNFKKLLIEHAPYPSGGLRTIAGTPNVE